METKNTPTTTDALVVTDGGKSVAGDSTKETPKTFSQDELNAILQKRLAEEGEKSQKAIQDSVQKALEEERRIAGLTQKEKEAEQLRKSQEEIQNSKNEVALERNKFDFVKKLDENKIPIKFVDFILDTNSKVMDERFNTLKNEWDNALKGAVADHLKGNTSLRDPNKIVSGGKSDAPVRTL